MSFDRYNRCETKRDTYLNVIWGGTTATTENGDKTFSGKWFNVLGHGCRAFIIFTHGIRKTLRSAIKFVRLIKHECKINEKH